MHRLRLRRNTWSARFLGVAAVILALASSSHGDPLAEAQRLLLTGKHAAAAAAFAKLPGGAAATIGRARALVAQGKSGDAWKQLEAADGAQEPAADVLGEWALLQFERGDFSAAEKSAAAALAAKSSQLSARWVRAELARASGKYDDALAGYKWFVDHYNATDEIADPAALHTIGQAAAQYARWKRLSPQFDFLVNELYPDALALDKHYWPAHYETGLLFLEKFNFPAAQKAFDAALAINPSAAEVHAARAMLSLRQYDLPAAQKSLDRALQVNPESLPALLVQIDLALVNFDYPAAHKFVAAALERYPRSEELQGRHAALLGVEHRCLGEPKGTPLGEWITTVEKINPRSGDFYSALGDTLDLLRRYPAAAKYYRLAGERMPQRIDISGKLGMVLMRLGQEAEAGKLLAQSFADDPFNLRVKNTLAVLDVLQGYAVLETPHFILRFDRGRDEILAQCLARHLEDDVFPQLTQQLGYVPREKTLIEIFNRAKQTDGHGWFSARMVGLPYIGTVAACAGQMVAMQSPNERDEKFDWAQVVRHEFMHVVNLQQTDFQIPHWLTEALAVRTEETPPWATWNKLLVRRVGEQDRFDLSNLNLAFVRPKTPDDWSLAYCQATLYLEYAIERFGADADRKLLRAVTEKPTLAEAIRTAYGVELADFEAGYGKFLETRVAEIKAGKRQPPAEVTLAECRERAAKFLKDGDAKQALHWAQRALHRDAHDPAAHRQLAEVFAAQGNQDRAREHYRYTLRLDARDEAAKSALKQLETAK